MSVVSNSGGATFITGRTMHVVSKSRYGRKAIQNSTREISNARYFASSNGKCFARLSRTHTDLVHHAVDPAAKERIETAMRDAKMKLDMVEEEHKDLRRQLESVQREGQGMQNELVRFSLP